MTPSARPARRRRFAAVALVAAAFVALRDTDPEAADAAADRVAADWRPESAAFLLEVIPFSIHAGQRERLFGLLRAKTGQPIGDFRYDDWYDWLWRQPPPDPAALFRLRHAFYDAHRFPLGSLAGYFAGDPPAAVRADEIRWGGVLRDGIPPLRRPKMVPAAAAGYLADTDRVFGLVVGGHARAYPRRILGVHELLTDEAGGEPVTAVYCPLCDAMIGYRSRTADGAVHRFGTSGFLYRSNKLMYDADTLSLWYTLTGRPVVGRLVGTGVRLDPLPVVTTTWAEWKAAHPDTAVIDLTALQQDADLNDPDFATPTYPEGHAYKAYFATDALLFGVPARDARLRDKERVFVPVPPGDHPPVAVAAARLAADPVLHLAVGPSELVVVTSPGGASRAYQTGGRRFRRTADPGRLADADGRAWAVAEDGLRADGLPPLPRCPAHHAFWFAWYAAHPDTVLVR